VAVGGGPVLRHRLLLFDIDGTLLDCGPQVRPLFAAALEEVFGTAGDIDRYDFAGRTDPGIVFDLLLAAGRPADEIQRLLPAARDTYLDRLSSRLDGRGIRALPGVLELLPALAGRDDLTLALLTGNWERGARIKLSHHDLNRYFPFGAFGCDGRSRDDLPPVALARAESAAGRRFHPEETLILGDSLLDVACARAHGIPVMAVATGRTPAGVLAAAGADWVAADLPAAAEILDWI
jgi:phosphoglycolate phosphatase